MEIKTALFFRSFMIFVSKIILWRLALWVNSIETSDVSFFLLLEKSERCLLLEAKLIQLGFHHVKISETYRLACAPARNLSWVICALLFTGSASDGSAILFPDGCDVSAIIRDKYSKFRQGCNNAACEHLTKQQNTHGRIYSIYGRYISNDTTYDRIRFSNLFWNIPFCPLA